MEQEIAAFKKKQPGLIYPAGFASAVIRPVEGCVFEGVFGCARVSLEQGSYEEALNYARMAGKFSVSRDDAWEAFRRVSVVTDEGDARQSDRTGRGVLFAVGLARGEAVADPSVSYFAGPAPRRLSPYEYIQYADGYFLLRDGDAGGKAMAAGALGTLAFMNAGNKDAIVRAGAIEQLKALQRDGDAGGKKQSDEVLEAVEAAELGGADFTTSPREAKGKPFHAGSPLLRGLLLLAS